MTSVLYIDGGGPVDVDFIELSALSAESTNITISVSFGAAVSSRKIIVAVHFAAVAGSPAITAATIGGVTATDFDGAFFSAVQRIGLRWIGAEVPSGTSGDVVLTFNTAVVARLGVYRMIDAESITKIDSAASTWSATHSAQTINNDVEDKGVLFAGSTVDLNGGTFSFIAGPASADYNQSITGSSDYRIAAGFELISADETGRSVTLTKSATATWQGALVSVSFR
jgi:hypothetical protein